MSLAATLVLSFLLTVLGHGKTVGNAQAQTTVTADVTDTPTPSVTPTDTPTVTPTDTPTVTPTVSVTPTVEPSVTPTITPSITPVATVTPTPVVGDGDKDDMLNLKANFHALYGLMNAALHHEKNETRFEAKHGVSKDEK